MISMEYGREELDDLADDLNQDEMELVLRFMRRIHKGREDYGELDISSDRRDWRKERREELLDLVAYDLIDEIAEERRKASRGRR